MPHHPKPFFRQSRGLWYVELRGKQINLGSDRDAAFQRYHELLAAPAKEPVIVDTSLVASRCDIFLNWVEKNRARKRLSLRPRQSAKRSVSATERESLPRDTVGSFF